MTEHAFKFLARGARSPISLHAWSRPEAAASGAWVEVEGALVQCKTGVHACRTDALAHWLHDELWVIELDGEQVAGLDCVIARRARLVRQVEAWSQTGAARFAQAARDHAASLVAAQHDADRASLQAVLASATGHLQRGATALSAYCSAMAVAWLRGGSRFDEAGYRQERSWQSAFIARDLGL